MIEPVRLTLRTRSTIFPSRSMPRRTTSSGFASKDSTVAHDHRLLHRYLPRTERWELAGGLLPCAGDHPQWVIVFGNISPSNESMNIAVKRARRLFHRAPTALLLSLGAGRIDERLENERGKYNLVLVAIRDVPVSTKGRGHR